MPVRPFEPVQGQIEGLWVIELKEVGDSRGCVREFYRESDFLAAGMPSMGHWAQVNITESQQGVIRGLHGEAMNKLVSVASGGALGAYLDARPDSPTFGRVQTVELEPGRAVLVPSGVCNGFQATAENGTQYMYCFDQEWRPDMPGLAFNPLDPGLGISWPIAVESESLDQISEKDRQAPFFDPEGHQS